MAVPLPWHVLLIASTQVGYSATQHYHAACMTRHTSKVPLASQKMSSHHLGSCAGAQARFLC